MIWYTEDMKKVTPFLWFEKDAQGIIAYYKSLFGEENIKVFGGEHLSDTPSGSVETFVMHIFDQEFTIMTAGKHDTFNDAISFTVSCRDQDEIDRYWNAITQEGKESQCGWCIDKYGLRWQIVPENLSELLARPDSVQHMLTMKKLVISEF